LAVRFSLFITSAQLVEASGEVPRGDNMLYSGTDPESYITEYTLVYEAKVGTITPGPDGGEIWLYGHVSY